jgi:NADH-quinone oxidoreductase subunit G
MLQFSGLREPDSIRSVSLPVGDKVVRVAVVHGLINAQKLLKDIEEGRESYDLVEVMTCKTGCVGGAGQPHALIPQKRQRAEGLYEADRGAMIQNSEFNPIVKDLYEHGLAERAHELLHVHYYTGDE